MRVGGVIEAVDGVAQSGAASVYVEILSKHGVRVPAPTKASPNEMVDNGAADDEA